MTERGISREAALAAGTVGVLTCIALKFIPGGGQLLTTLPVVAAVIAARRILRD